jgi:hypothetical protein
MLYYNGRNITPWICLFFIVVFSIFFFYNNQPEPTEKIVGYEIDEMRDPDNKPFYDTVGVILRKGREYTIRDVGKYTFTPRR